MEKMPVPTELIKIACPKCDMRTPAKNFCAYCLTILSYERYFNWLANKK